MPAALKLVSSMATRQVLAALLRDYEVRTGQAVALESVGGVDAAKRVRAGEALDAVALASDVIDQLAAEGCLVAGSRADVVRSGIAVAVRAGAPRPDIGTEDAVRRAVAEAPSLSYSTGPSGTHLQKLFARWGVADAVAARTVQAPPGVPVGTLVADGRASLGFQQYPELKDLPGIVVLGPLPPAIQLVTTFSAGVATTSTRPGETRALLAHLASPGTAATKRRHGMEPA